MAFGFGQPFGGNEAQYGIFGIGDEGLTTTFAAIRDQLVGAIQALTPLSNAGVVYRYAPRAGHEYRDFRDWAEGNDSNCMRMFDITEGEQNPAGAMDQDIWRIDTTLQLVVAYPRHFRLYGDDNSGDMADVMSQDLTQLTVATGLYGRVNYPNGAVPKLPETRETERGEGVDFSVLTVGLEYYLDTIP